MDIQLKDEVWVQFPIKGYVDYLISNHGRLSSKKDNPQGKILKWRNHHKGYFKIAVSKEGKMKQYFVHRIVALAFIPNPNGYSQINHIDCDKKNNHVSNLEWCDQAHNMKHAKENGLNRSLRGNESPVAKITEKDVIEIREKYKNGNYTRKMLGEEYGLKPCSIYDITNRRSWRHI